jgi:hypothetical protein
MTKGTRVVYIPSHAHEDFFHSDCERGVVSSVRDSIVFVKYDNLSMKMVTGDEPYTSKATNIEDLVEEVTVEAYALLKKI